MAAVANLTIQDGTATPVNVTYMPEYRDEKEVIWSDRRLANPSMWPRLYVGYDRATRNRPTFHVEYRVEYPIVRPVDGVDAVAATARFERGRYIIPAIATEQERKHLSALVRNGLSNAAIRGVPELLDPFI